MMTMPASSRYLLNCSRKRSLYCMSISQTTSIHLEYQSSVHHRVEKRRTFQIISKGWLKRVEAFVEFSHDQPVSIEALWDTPLSFTSDRAATVLFIFVKLVMKALC